MVETLTAVAAVVGAITGLLNSMQIAQLRGRVDALEAVMQTIMTALIGRSDSK